jgi:hypothetical protein
MKEFVIGLVILSLLFGTILSEILFRKPNRK